MSKSRVINLSIRLGALVLMVLIVQILSLHSSSSKAYAACGIDFGTDSAQKQQYGGLVVNLLVVGTNGAEREALGNIGMRFTMDGNTPPGYWGAELAYYDPNGADPHISSGDIPQTGGHNLGEPYCNYTGDGAGVVLGTGGDKAEWLIDCNASVRNGDPGWAYYTGYGVPDGARAGGTWQVAHVQVANSANNVIGLRYYEPQAPVYGWAQYLPTVTSPPLSAVNPLLNSDCVVGGWALDGGNASAKIRVDIYWDHNKDDPLRGPPNSVTANQYWPGVATDPVIAPLGPGPDDSATNQGHGYFTTVPPSLRDGNPHTAYAYGVRSDGTLVELNYTPARPISFTCGSGGGSSTFKPWLQTGNSNVSAWGGITGQTFGSPAEGQRPNQITATDPVEATYLVMAALQRGSDKNNVDALTGVFCSTNGYILGLNAPTGCTNNKRYQFDVTEAYTVDNTTGPPLGYVMQNSGSTISDLLNGTNGEESDMMNTKMNNWRNEVNNCYPGWIREINISGNTIDGSGFFSGGSAQKFRTTQFAGGGNPTNQNLNPTTGLQANNTECLSSVLAATSPSVSGLQTFDLGGLTFDRGGRVTYWVRPRSSSGSYSGRDVYIRSNINTDLKNTTSYPSGGPQNAPQIAIVASGNIYIDPSVTNLDASLYATGKIFSCYRPASSSLPGPKGGSSTNYYRNNGPTCKNQLVIRGSVMARSGLVLGRTYFSNPGTFTSSAEKIYIPGQALAFPPLGWNKDNLEKKESLNIRYLDVSEGPRF